MKLLGFEKGHHQLDGSVSVQKADVICKSWVDPILLGFPSVQITCEVHIGAWFLRNGNLYGGDYDVFGVTQRNSIWLVVKFLGRRALSSDGRGGRLSVLPGKKSRRMGTPGKKSGNQSHFGGILRQDPELPEQLRLAGASGLGVLGRGHFCIGIVHDPGLRPLGRRATTTCC